MNIIATICNRPPMHAMQIMQQWHLDDYKQWEPLFNDRQGWSIVRLLHRAGEPSGLGKLASVVTM